MTSNLNQEFTFDLLQQRQFLSLFVTTLESPAGVDAISNLLKLYQFKQAKSKFILVEEKQNHVIEIQDSPKTVSVMRIYLPFC